MTDKEAVFRLLKLGKGNTKKIILIILFLIISSLISLVMPLISKNIVDNGFLKHNYNLIVYLAIIILVLAIIDNSIDLCKEVIRTKIKADITYKLFNKAFSHIEKIKISELNKTSNTEILNNLHSDISNISMMADGVFFSTIKQIFNIVGGMIGLIIISWKLTLVVICFIPVKFIVINGLVKKRKKIINEYMISYSEFARWFGDTLAGIKELKIFDIFNEKMKEFSRMQKNIVHIDRQVSIQDSINTVFDQLLIQVMTFLLYILGANMVFKMQLTIGSIFAFISYSISAINPISSIFNLGFVLSSIIPAAKRYYNFLSIEEETYLGNTSMSDKIKYNPNIYFENVYFSYDGKKDTLKNINFHINKGEKIALIGLNGSGKSTIINLIMRFYKPLKGTIYFNEINIDEININTYRRSISIVSQDSYLFDDTIRKNICLYKNIEEEKFINILNECNLYDFYKTLPENYKIGENGCLLSGGQRQKIFIARALATENNLIILDEATSNIDIETEKQINNLICTKFKDKTMIIITHKPSILNYMDKVIVLQDGKIQDIGVHKSLLKSSKLYNEILMNNLTL